MKKIFKIASYDFKRLIVNPFTIGTMLLVLIVCLITGLVYKIEPTPAYTATISGATTKDIYNNFMSTNEAYDNKVKLDDILEDGERMISVQQECDDYDLLTDINSQFQEIYYEVVKFHTTGSCTYTQNGNITTIKTASNELDEFVEYFKGLEEFESNLIFETAEFETLENISTFFHEQANSTETIPTILTNLYDNISNFNSIDSVVKHVFVWKVDSELLQEYQTKYIEKATTKRLQILDEIVSLNNQVTTYDTTHMEEMTSLITNYKLTCESAKYSVMYELRLSLERHFGDLENLYHYQPISIEDTELALVKTNYFLNDESLYYTQYQVPLNFNTASYQVSLYDHAYFVMSIIGFLTILFGIFASYKQFGLDRRNGKMDTILSQNVTFNQVFTGKFLAIVYATSFVLAVYSILSLTWGALLFPSLANEILAVFNLTSVYTIHPFLFFIIKVIGIELQVIFYSVITIFLMNVSRKFELTFGISVGIFVIATICNIFLNGSLAYCLFPFIHADLTAFLGGGTMQTGFLKTALYSYGNFFISLVYYLVVVVLLYNFTKQLFKKN